MAEQPILKLEKLTKVFPGVIANDSIDLEVNAGEILSILGENGAGKSTFCKMLTGVYNPDGGSIYLDGREIKISSPIESTKLGIGMVYQERNLVGNLSVAENICLGHEPLKGVFLNDKEIYEKAEEVREKLKIDLPLDVRVSELGAGEQQLVEIMRAFYNNPKVLILDEPTASLGMSEVNPFLDFLMHIKKELNLAIIFISHKLDEVFKISDRIAVFTDGKCTLFDKMENLTQEQCVRAMLRNHSIGELDIAEKDLDHLPVVLDVKRIEYGGKKQKVRFQIHEGEILGAYGLVGSGRTECAEVLYGLRDFDECEFALGDIAYHNKKHTPLDMLHHGMILTPEIRGNGIFKKYSLVENVAMLHYEKMLCNKFGVVDEKKTRSFATTVVEKNGVKYKSVDQEISTLSGGNIQKIVIGRSLEIEGIKLLIVDEPTTGMDIGAKHEVYEKIMEAAAKGIAVLFISSELDELLTVCDRLVVFRGGSIGGQFDRKEMDKSKILTLALDDEKEVAM